MKIWNLQVLVNSLIWQALFDTLNSGSVIVVDELDAKMHPLISQELVSLFNDPSRNINGAQFIFSTHDTNLLSCHLLRRDQIWFTEKDSQERTDIYNMMQIVLLDGKPRGDGNIERNYIRGRYGAIPYIPSLYRITMAKKLNISTLEPKIIIEPVTKDDSRYIRCQILIVCEGAKTEPYYLALLYFMTDIRIGLIFS